MTGVQTCALPISAGSTGPTPPLAAPFAAFAPKVGVRWDEKYLYVEAKGLPDHPLMAGIKSWQQQVPIPQTYAGESAWRIPLHPVPAKEPMSAKTHFMRGAIALAANGIPIFNALNNRGVTLKEAGRLAEALASYDRALSLKPQYAEAHGNRGNALKELGRLDEALASYDAALGLKPDYAEAHFNLAALLAAAEQPAEAARHYAEVGRLRPDDLVAHIRHGALLTAVGETDKAIEQYGRILVRWPDSLPALLALGTLYLTRGDANGSIDLYRRAARLAPESAEIAAGLGRALKRGGLRAEAIAEYQRALALEPDHRDALNFLVLVEIDREDASIDDLGLHECNGALGLLRDVVPGRAADG